MIFIKNKKIINSRKSILTSASLTFFLLFIQLTIIDYLQGYSGATKLRSDFYVFSPNIVLLCKFNTLSKVFLPFHNKKIFKLIIV
jgi:hypothetical protein